MRLIRSWPEYPPEDHPQVIDNCERIYLHRPDMVDYTALSQADDNLLHLDWDVAVNRDELRMFAAKCEAEPDRVRVAPTINWVTRHKAHRGILPNMRTQWLVWRQLSVSRRNCVPGENCDYFGFGMVYLPIRLIQMYKAERPSERFNDMSFSKWHYNEYLGGWGKAPTVPVEWDVHAVHINYSMADALNDQE